MEAEPSGIHDALASLARRTPPGVLLSAECLGFLAILSILAWLPGRFAFILPFAALASFGLWGTADRARRKSETRRARSAFSLFQLMVAIVGFVSLVALLFALGGVLVGTVIS